MTIDLARNTAALVLALTVFVFLGCQTEREAEAPDTMDRTAETDLETDETDLEPAETEPGVLPEEGAPIATAQFQPGKGAEGRNVQGTLQVLPISGEQGMEVKARVEGLTEGEHAWHIHSAPCGQEAPVVVPFTSTQQKEGIGAPLEAGSDGTAEGSVDVPPDELTRQQVGTGAYSVHVHAKGGIDHGPTVACANL